MNVCVLNMTPSDNKTVCLAMFREMSFVLLKGIREFTFAMVVTSDGDVRVMCVNLRQASRR